MQEGRELEGKSKIRSKMTLYDYWTELLAKTDAEMNEELTKNGK